MIPAPAGQRTIRLHNLSLVLSMLSRLGEGNAVGRAGLAQRTGLTKATVTAAIEDLLAADIVVEGEAVLGGLGRPSRPVRWNSHGPVALGIECNVDYNAACLLDLSGRVRGHRRVEVDNRQLSAAAVVAGVGRLAAELIEATQRESGSPLAILGCGLALPGVVSPDGQVLRTPNLPTLTGSWPARLLLGDSSGERAGADPMLSGERAGADPMLSGSDQALSGVGATFSGVGTLSGAGRTQVGNEANFAALAWLRFADRQLAAEIPAASQDFVYITGEIGIGAGIVVDGRLFTGVSGFAGELGHVVVDAAGPACRCGGQGCVEQYAGLDVLLAAAAQPDLPALVAALGGQDQAAHAAIDSAAAALGVGISSMLNILDIPTVVLGGLFADLFDQLSPGLLAELDRRVLFSRSRGGRLRRSGLGADAAVRGAAGSVIDNALRNPQLLVGEASTAGPLTSSGGS